MLTFPTVNRILIAVALASLAGPGDFAEAQITTIDIQAGQPGKPISPDLIGVFFEDLNYAADGGLYAELIQNRSFEYSPTEHPDWHPRSFWELQKRGGGDGTLGVAEMRPIHENNPHYALLTVSKPGDGVGLVNGGFDGVPLKAGEDYEASFWAYQAYMGQMWGNGDHSRPMPITLRLESGNGEVLAEARMQIQGREWRRSSVTLKPARTAKDARLILLAHETGAVALDMVSLFPKQTFRNRPNGLRADLAQAVADLKPKFVRFPGGCLVHGSGIRRYYNWKDSIGPVEQRRARPNNSWGYHQTMGLGYFEYFQFCEDIGARPLPVVTAGVCCQHAGSSPGRGQEGLPLDEMPAYIQDVLDLIEWANGPATSKWGAKRAAAGHPAPFGLKYVGVGNEDAITPIFRERFRMIYRALKEKHPEIVVVGTSGPFASGEDYDNGWAFARELELPMVDEHYYVAPQWFWSNLTRYDRYDRNSAKVYVGEYAAHDRDKRRSTLRSALAEAAGMTAFERNGDVVHFASYAPLLARRGHTQWHPDLIYFTGTEIHLTASYYAQQLFGQNGGDRYLDTTIAPASRPPMLAASTVLDSQTGDLIVKIVNGAGVSAAMKVKLAGFTGAEYKATRTVLTGANADAFNEDNQPLSVKPVVSEVTLKPEFDYEAPACSLSVFRVRGGVSRRADLPVPRTDRNSRLAHEQSIAKAKRGGIDAYFVGDSITRRWGATDYPELLAHWTANFFGWNAGNFGWGADRTENILWRLENGELDGVNPRIIVVLAGINNVGSSPGGQTKVEDITRGLQAIVKVCQAKAPNAVIVLTGLFPRNDHMAVMPEINRINDNLARMSDGTKIRYLNVNDKLADKTGKLIEGMSNDGLHPTLRGYAVWADALKPIFTEILGPPAKTDHAPPPTGDPSAKPPTGH